MLGFGRSGLAATPPATGTPTLDHRNLGRSDLTIPPLMVGGNVFGWTADAATSDTLLDALLDAGLTAIDTADIYSAWAPGHSGGESERVIGDWLKRDSSRRAKVVIATKVGGKMGSGDSGLKPDWIAKACDNSLARLGVERIDLYQAHFDDAGTPLADTLGAFARLIEAGKVRAIGCSNYSVERLREALDISAAHNLPRYEGLQPHYNLMERPLYEGPLEDLCVAEDVGVITYFSLAAGFLSGKYRSTADLGKSQRGGGMAKYLNDKGTRVLAAVDAAATELSATAAQVALAWVMARASVTSAIVSATSLDQVSDLVSATRLHLSADHIAALDAASA